MMFRSRCIAFLAVCGACTSAAMADGFGFEGAQYVVGGGLNNVVDGNGNTWQKEGTETSDWIVDNVVVSPLANPLVGGASTKSVRFDMAGPFARLGMDLANPVLTGIVTLQWDFRNDVRLSGNSVCNFYMLNRSVAPAEVINTNVDILWRFYIQNGGNFAAAQNVQTGLGGSASVADFFGIFGDCRGQAPAFPDIYCNNAFSPQLFPEAQGANDRWYRVKMWLDLSDTANPGRLLYAAIYDINCGSEVQVAEHHIVNQLTPIKKFNNTAPTELRAFQLRATGGDPNDANPIDHRMWVDNIVIAADPTFVVPSPIASPPVPATTLNADAGTQEVTTAFTLPTSAGDSPSICRSGSNFYTLDNSNGLTTWSGGGSSTFTDDALEVEFSSDPTGIMTADTSGNLYAVANLVGSPGAGWRDLLRYDSGTGTWVQVTDGDIAGNTGNHSAALLTFGGTNHVVHAWTGAPEYPSLNTDGTRGPSLLNVGNRWAGACTEKFADGSTGNELYFLQQTDAVGNPISNNVQEFNAIYRAGYGIGCDAGNTLRTRVSNTARLLPWVTNAPDGADVNRHAMEYEPARDRVWVIRAGGSNEIGIYDTAQDRFGVLKLTRNSVPLAMDRADIQLSADGSQMYIMSRGEPAVYAVSTNVTFVNTGACIVGPNCSLMTMADCATAGGAYQGDNNTCPPPGACCNGDTCTISYQVTCAAGGGTFQGDNTVCNDYTVGAGGAFEDIFATGTDVPGIGDDDSVTIPIGFSFTHFGNTYTDVRVGANGYLSFSGTDGAQSWVPNIGSADEPNNLIAGLWTDLSPQCTVGGLKYEVRGTAPSRRLIVQWTNVTQFTGDCNTPVDQNTFQIVLFEGSNNAEVHFGLLNEPDSTPLPAYQSGVENADGSQSVLVDNSLIVDNGSVALTQTPNPCLCPADFNNSGTVSVQDIFDFLAAYFSGNPAADVNHSGTVSVQDIFDFLALYFAGC